jgi:hypothetical protein
VDPASTLPDRGGDRPAAMRFPLARPVQEIVYVTAILKTEVKACAIKEIALITVTIEVPQALDE